MRKLALLACLGLTACGLQQAEIYPESNLAAIPADYKQQILAWAKRYYVEPSSLRGAQISDPVPVVDRAGDAMWLVCIQVDARAKDGPYMGPQRAAIGIKPALFSAPLERGTALLVSHDCTRLTLRWRPWPELERVSSPTPARVSVRR